MASSHEPRQKGHLGGAVVEGDRRHRSDGMADSLEKSRIACRLLPLIVTLTRVIGHHAVFARKHICLMVRRRIAGDIHGSRISRRLRRDIIHLFGGPWLLPWPGQRLRRTGKHHRRRAVPNRGRPWRRHCLPRPNQRVRGWATCSHSGEQHNCNRANQFLQCGLSENAVEKSYHVLLLPSAKTGRTLRLYASVISLPLASRPNAVRPANATATTATVTASTAG